MTSNFDKKSIVMLGASGAVGAETVQTLLATKNIKRLTLLGRNSIEIEIDFVKQHKIDIFDPTSYVEFLSNHETAICTLGVGEPSKMGKAEFVKIDKTAVFDFAKACKEAGIIHFELLSAVGADSQSSNHYLRTKGELVADIMALNFDRFSVFQPSMILTPNNRYGVSQAIMLSIWPFLSSILIGSWRKYRGISVEILGKSIALNIFSQKSGLEKLEWDDFNAISEGHK
jgi:uncharacterized protein YbjT (DUF2867 family)